MVKIYHNPRCSKSRQTLQLLIENGVEPEIIEYLTHVPSRKELSEVITKLSIKPKDLIRTKEDDFKPYKGQEFSDDEWIDILVKHPKLIERPIVVSGQKAAIGRPPEKVLEVL
jgi:arsenate reductase (glutaredoxin)